MGNFLPNRYCRNQETISCEEQQKLREVTACIVGLGGLGGYISEQLARLGVGNLVLIDGDVIEESNLNRQQFATEQTLGLSKAEAANMRLRSVNSEVRYKVCNTRLTKENSRQLVSGADIVFDALDNLSTKFILQKTCAELKLPLVHGAIGGWYGQVCVIMPGDNTLDVLYRNDTEKGIEKALGNPPFTPAIVASIQVAEAVKFLLGKGEALQKRLLRIDLLSNEYVTIQL